MDVRTLAISTVFMGATYAWPTDQARVDFRGEILQPVTIINNQGSPAYAALETMNLNIPGRTESIEDLLVAHNEVSTGSIAKGDSSSRSLSGLVISANRPQNQLQEILDQSVAEEPAVTSVYEMARVLVEEELFARSEETSAVRKIPTKSGVITIAKADAPVEVVHSVPIPNASIGPIAKNTQSWGGRIDGSATLMDGAALTGLDDELIVYHSVDGRIGSTARAHARDGSFQLNVAGLTGELVAEIRGKNGAVLGRGTRNLEEIPSAVRSKGFVKDLSVEIYPFYDGVNGAVVSAASIGGKNLYVKDAKMILPDLGREIALNRETMTYRDSTISTGSTVIVNAIHNNFWPSLSLQTSGTDFNVRLFSHSLIRALRNLVGETYVTKENETKGLVWGRIASGDQPAQGVVVGLAGEQEHRPVYFNGYLPDHLSKATTNSGEFAFINIEPGEHFLTLSTPENSYWPALVIVGEKTVSYSDISLLPPRNMEFVSYDAFAGTPIASVVRPLGAEAEYVVNETGEALYSLPAHNGISYLESQSVAEYHPVRVAVSGAPASVLFPMVKTEWLRKILDIPETEQKIPNNVVGFIQEEDFSVIVGAESAGTNIQVVYFDAEGNATSDSGLAGGGFVIAGLETGIHTVTVLSKQSSRIHSQVVYVDEYASQVMLVSNTF